MLRRCSEKIKKIV